MKKVPNMITSKDLAYIGDMFNWNIILINKLNYYISTVTDETLTTKFRNLVDMHTKNANELLKILRECKC